MPYKKLPLFLMNMAYINHECGQNTVSERHAIFKETCYQTSLHMYQDCKTLNIYYDLTDDPRHLPTTSVATLEINQILEAGFLSSSSLFKGHVSRFY